MILTANEARARAGLPPHEPDPGDRIGLGDRNWLHGVIAVALVVLAGYLGFCAIANASTRPCKPIAKCRTSIAWNHQVINTLNGRLAIANGRAGGGRSTPACHTLAACQRLQRSQSSSRIWAEEAWTRLTHDETKHGAMRVVRYLFHPCGKTAQVRAALIVGWESSWLRFNINGAGDTSWWQVEKGADSPPGHGYDPHPDVTVAQAEDDWASTEIAVRWSKCGTDFSPTWTSVRDHGKDWD